MGAARLQLRLGCALLLALALPLASAVAPAGPSQQCADDMTRPGWTMSSTGVSGTTRPSPRRAVGRRHDCPRRSRRRARPGKIAAFLAGPIDCDKQGWFCGIERQDGFVPATVSDSNRALQHSGDEAARTDTVTDRTATRRTVGGCATTGSGGTRVAPCCCDWNVRLDEPLRLPAASVGGGGSPDVPGRQRGPRFVVRGIVRGARRARVRRSRVAHRRSVLERRLVRRPRGGGDQDRRGRERQIRSDGFVIRVRDFVAPPLARRVGLRGHLRRLGDYRRVRVDAHRECSRVFKSVHVY